MAAKQNFGNAVEMDVLGMFRTKQHHCAACALAILSGQQAHSPRNGAEVLAGTSTSCQAVRVPLGFFPVLIGVVGLIQGSRVTKPQWMHLHVAIRNQGPWAPRMHAASGTACWLPLLRPGITGVSHAALCPIPWP
jgi:hypothetical protein